MAVELVDDRKSRALQDIAERTWKFGDRVRIVGDSRFYNVEGSLYKRGELTWYVRPDGVKEDHPGIACLAYELDHIEETSHVE